MDFPKHSYKLTIGQKEDSLIHRLRTFIGHHDLRIYLTDASYIDVGRGSFSAALNMSALAGDFEGCVGTIGQMCNFAVDCQLLAGGEHWNDVPVNIVFTNIPAFPLFGTDLQTLKPRSKQPFTIGNGVVVSAGAMVLSGVQLGNGCVLGAGSVATRDLRPFGIYGGVPAKLIRQRFDGLVQSAIESVRWWDFDILYLRDNLAHLQGLAVDGEAPHLYRTPTPKLVVKLLKRGASFDAEIPGFIQDGRFRPLSSAPQSVQRYLAQLGGSPPFYWLPDMWE